ncbi:hypothetical protein BCR37DRAFT_398889 [Protomyces lactucae-debilis]|uniref:Mid2 domain-containing protein n=1 Tax=Protomyces lactucae-debilis TaxID=2754530 RepID=A0A1Y2FDX9_PROLT|nr:uncharacterized protein BCR37DRAFT_398889 [Protomyces lactucae-debilis]ORY82113.1 hypothetical protein BCR37DRAFT_398889 [Protomyces lactucae-debilis]
MNKKPKHTHHKGLAAEGHVQNSKRNIMDMGALEKEFDKDLGQWVEKTTHDPSHTTRHAHSQHTEANKAESCASPPMSTPTPALNAHGVLAVKAASPLLDDPLDASTPTPSSSCSSQASSRSSYPPSSRQSNQSIPVSRVSVSPPRQSTTQSSPPSQAQPAPYPTNTLVVTNVNGTIQNITYGNAHNGSDVLPWLRKPTALAVSATEVGNEAIATPTMTNAMDDLGVAVASSVVLTASPTPSSSAGTLGPGTAGSLRSDSSTGLSQTGKTVLGSVLGVVGGLGLLCAVALLLFSQRKRRRLNKRDSKTALASDKQKSYASTWTTPNAAAAIRAREIGSAGESGIGQDAHERSFHVVSGQHLPQPPSMILPGQRTRGVSPSPIVFRNGQPPPGTGNSDGQDPFSDSAAIAWPLSAGMIMSDAQPSPDSSPTTFTRTGRIGSLAGHSSRASLTASGSRFVEHGL